MYPEVPGPSGQGLSKLRCENRYVVLHSANEDTPALLGLLQRAATGRRQTGGKRM